MKATPHPPPTPHFVAGNLALDFINTAYGVGPDQRDCFMDAAGVMAWLAQAGLLPADTVKPPPRLHPLARELRDSARSLVMAARTGGPADTAVVNRVLASGRPELALAWDRAEARFHVTAPRRPDDAASLLHPVAQSLVDLLTRERLDLVRQCEAHDCTLLFHDLTKSHRRRWCSMAACGNRMKVAAFRARQKGA